MLLLPNDLDQHPLPASTAQCGPRCSADPMGITAIEVCSKAALAPGHVMCYSRCLFEICLLSFCILALRH